MVVDVLGIAVPVGLKEPRILIEDLVLDNRDVPVKHLQAQSYANAHHARSMAVSRVAEIVVDF